MTQCVACGNDLTAQEERYADIAGMIDFQECLSCRAKRKTILPKYPSHKEQCAAAEALIHDTKRELYIHAAHIKYGDRWEQMALEVSAFARKHEIGLSKSDLALQEITSLLCEIKYN